MRSLAVSLLCVWLSGCAADVWNRRVYACDEIRSFALVDSRLELDADDDDGCYVEVRDLQNQELDDGVLAGTDVEVLATGSFGYDVLNTVIVHDAGGLEVEGDIGDYLWLPEEGRFDARNVSGGLTLNGPLRSITLDAAGDVDLTPGAGFDTLTGNAASIRFETRVSFTDIDVVADGDAELLLPWNEQYDLTVDPQGAYSTDGLVRAVEVNPTAKVTVQAGGDISVDGRPGGDAPFAPRFRNLAANCSMDRTEVAVYLETDVANADAAWVEFANTGTDGEIVYESHQLRPGELEPSSPDHSGFVVLLRTDQTTGQFATRFDCGPSGTDFDEDPLGSRMSYVVRFFDDEARIVECYAIGHDPESMLWREHGTASFRAEGLDPNLCDVSFWETP